MSNAIRLTECQGQLLAAIRASSVDGMRGWLRGHILDLDNKESHFFTAARSLLRRGIIDRRIVKGEPMWHAD